MLCPQAINDKLLNSIQHTAPPDLAWKASLTNPPASSPLPSPSPSQMDGHHPHTVPPLGTCPPQPAGEPEEGRGFVLSSASSSRPSTMPGVLEEATNVGWITAWLEIHQETKLGKVIGVFQGGERKDQNKYWQLKTKSFFKKALEFKKSSLPSQTDEDSRSPSLPFCKGHKLCVQLLRIFKVLIIREICPYAVFSETITQCIIIKYILHEQKYSESFS